MDLSVHSKFLHISFSSVAGINELLLMVRTKCFNNTGNKIRFPPRNSTIGSYLKVFIITLLEEPSSFLISDYDLRSDDNFFISSRFSCVQYFRRPIALQLYFLTFSIFISFHWYYSLSLFIYINNWPRILIRGLSQDFISSFSHHLCGLCKFLYISGGIYSLKLIPNDRFFFFL